MAIDDSGEWWKGSEPSDILVFLDVYTRSDAAYPTTAFRQVLCACGANLFRLVRARSLTQRTCVACSQLRYISRGGGAGWEEAAEEEPPECYRCVGCGGEETNVCVGFAGYPEAQHIIDGVKWFYVGVRCATCGILCCWNEGKIGRSPAEQVYPEVTGEVEG